jgi:hypothetical protein
MKTSLIFIALLAVVSMSCHHSTAPAVSPNVGELKGRVIPLDVNGDTLPSLFGGTSAFIKGTNFITTTDSTGRWVLKNVPAGTYSVMCAKSAEADFDTAGYGQINFSGVGVDSLADVEIVRMPTDTIVLDYAYITDSMVEGYNHSILLFGGHISSNNAQSINMYATTDSASTAGGVGGNWYVQNGKYSGGSWTVTDPSGNHLYTIDDLASGRNIFVCAELYPLDGYPGLAGYLTRDYSNTIEVTVP